MALRFLPSLFKTFTWQFARLEIRSKNQSHSAGSVALHTLWNENVSFHILEICVRAQEQLPSAGQPSASASAAKTKEISAKKK